MGISGRSVVTQLQETIESELQLYAKQLQERAHWGSTPDKQEISKLVGQIRREKVEKISRNIVAPAVYALSIRHMLQPSNALADFILLLPCAYDYLDLPQHKWLLGDAVEAAFVALVSHREGKWVQALITLATFGYIFGSSAAQSILDVLLSMRESLAEEERQVADEFAKEQFEQFLKEDTERMHLDIGRVQMAIKYLLQSGYPAMEIEKKLQVMKNAIADAGYYAQSNKDQLERLIKDISC